MLETLRILVVHGLPTASGGFTVEIYRIWQVTCHLIAPSLVSLASRAGISSRAWGPKPKEDLTRLQGSQHTTLKHVQKNRMKEEATVILFGAEVCGLHEES